MGDPPPERAALIERLVDQRIAELSQHDLLYGDFDLLVASIVEDVMKDLSAT